MHAPPIPPIPFNMIITNHNRLHRRLSGRLRFFRHGCTSQFPVSPNTPPINTPSATSTTSEFMFTIPVNLPFATLTPTDFSSSIPLSPAAPTTTITYAEFTIPLSLPSTPPSSSPSGFSFTIPLSLTASPTPTSDSDDPRVTRTSTTTTNVETMSFELLSTPYYFPTSTFTPDTLSTLPSLSLPSPSSTYTSEPVGKSTLSAGCIVGLTLGAVIVVGLLLGLVVGVLKKKRERQDLSAGIHS
jgi:hypothetical protein